MGDDPKTSVLNQYCQAWDCKNLFITDAAPFVSNADKNPTLTIYRAGMAHIGVHCRPGEEAEREGLEEARNKSWHRIETERQTAQKSAGVSRRSLFQ